MAAAAAVADSSGVRHTLASEIFAWVVSDEMKIDGQVKMLALLIGRRPTAFETNA